LNSLVDVEDHNGNEINKDEIKNYFEDDGIAFYVIWALLSMYCFVCLLTHDFLDPCQCGFFFGKFVNLEVEVENEILDTRFMDFDPKKVEIIKPQEVFML